MGLSNFVYPGANHSRFIHALGTAYLATELVNNLKSKGVSISDEEYEAFCVAALLHDLGHGPFSHALEHEILVDHHETITLALIKHLNQEFQGRLSRAIEILTGHYSRPFFKEALSSQLDIDRMDYLNRDSFYTGVAEGVIGYRRILKMMNVIDNRLVVEEKGIFSIEKFLVSRHMMYNQAYLHKTALGAELMLVHFFKNYKSKSKNGHLDYSYAPIDKLITSDQSILSEEILEDYAALDDHDIMYLLKEAKKSSDSVSSYIASCLLDRKLFRTIITEQPPDAIMRMKATASVKELLNTDDDILVTSLIWEGQVTNSYYTDKDEIRIFRKGDEEVINFSAISRFYELMNADDIYYLCFPKSRIQQ